MKWDSHRPVVGVTTPAQTPVAEQAKAILKGKVVHDVVIAGESLVIMTTDGATFSIYAPGGWQRMN